MNRVKFNRFPAQRPMWNELISDVFNSGFTNDLMNQKPAINIKQLEDSYLIELAAPGLKKEDFEIKIEKDQLVVSASMATKQEEKEENYTRREFSYSNFSRSFHLPETLDAEKIEAGYEAGVLTINIPKREEEIAKTRLISVN